MRPIVALEQQSLLRDRLTTPDYHAYMEAFLADSARKGSAPVPLDPETGKPGGKLFCDWEGKRLMLAEPYFVKEEMVPLVRWAAAGLNGTDRFAHDLWPSDYGFVYFEDGWLSQEVWGRTVIHKAMSWGRAPASDGHPGTYIVFYTDFEDPRDEVNAEIRAEAIAAEDWEKYQRMGRLHAAHMVWLPDDLRVGPERLPISERYAQYAVGEQVLAEDAPNDGRFILAFLMLLNQTVTDVDREIQDRKTARRFRRMGLPDAVTVIQLRRHKDANRYEGETLVEWSHRWIVRGFWRWQPYGSRTPDHDHVLGLVYVENGRRVQVCQFEGCDHRIERIYIAPFIKGPDGAPLKQSDKVYALVR